MYVWTASTYEFKFWMAVKLIRCADFGNPYCRAMSG